MPKKLVTLASQQILLLFPLLSQEAQTPLQPLDSYCQSCWVGLFICANGTKPLVEKPRAGAFANSFLTIRRVDPVVAGLKLQQRRISLKMFLFAWKNIYSVKFNSYEKLTKHIYVYNYVIICYSSSAEQRFA